MSLKLLDIERFLQNKKAKRVTNPKIFGSDMLPAKNGLQDSSIFGVSGNEKFGNWGYIDLENVIMHPLVYDNLSAIDPIFKRVRDKKTNVKIIDGKLVPDEKGGTGLSWLTANWPKINFDKYRNEKNKLWIDFLNNTNKNLVFIKKVPVIPIAYREVKSSSSIREKNEIDEIYQKLMGLSKSERTEFTDEYLQTMRDKTAKEIMQGKVNELYNYFISKIEGKQGFMRGALLGKRLDNVSRMVANARPDIPINSAVIPWQILLNLFDIFVVAYLSKEDSSEIREKLGLSEDKGFEEYGQLFDYIYRNVDTYDKHHPTHKKIWVEILEDLFNENPMMRILLKRDPGWNADSIWCFQPLINTENSYQVWVPSWVYSPLGGDSFNTNFFIQEKDTNIIYEDDRYLIEGSFNKTFAVKTMDSVWKYNQGGFYD
jgi:DNA-directed RNA polymerase beta' subunit